MGRQYRNRGWRRLASWRWLRGGLAGLVAGCQAMPAHVATCDHPDTPMPRTLLAAGQIVSDSAREAARRPLRSAGSAVVEPVLTVAQLGPGLRKRVDTCLGPPPAPIAADRPTLDLDALEGELRRIADDEPMPACVQLLTDGADALATLEAALDAATTQIDVLMYLWDNDPVGWEIARRIAARAGPGLRVRVLVDGGGNLLQGEPKSASAGTANAVVCWLARQPHVQVVRVSNAFLRFDHRKLVLVDGRLAWSGGRNFTREAFFEAHDLTYVLTGPLTSALAGRYEAYWREQGGPPGPPPPPPLPVPDANTLARLLRTRPYESDLARTVDTAIDHAAHHVYVENPYFTDDVLINKLVRARRRGVDVRVVMTLDTGVPIIDRANRATINRLLRAGIRVYLYPGRTHVKALSVDGLWAYVGTGNFDPLSLRHNRELGIAVSHGRLVGELEERLFAADMRPEWEVQAPLPWTAGEFLAEVVASWFL